MSCYLRTIATPRGDFIFRPERRDDVPFLFRLFAAHHGATLQLSGIPLPMIETLVEFQFRSQMQTYRKMYPNAIYSIIVWQGEDVGRFVEHEEADFVYFVDFLLDP